MEASTWTQVSMLIGEIEDIVGYQAYLARRYGEVEVIATIDAIDNELKHAQHLAEKLSKEQNTLYR